MKNLILFFRLIFFVILIFGIVYLIFQNNSFENFFSFNNWQIKKPWFFLLALFAFFLGICAKSLRFFLITQAKKKMPVSKTQVQQTPKKQYYIFNIIMLSYCISYFVLSSGIFVKAAALKRYCAQSLFTTVTQVLLEKILSLFLMVPFFFFFGYLLLKNSFSNFLYLEILLLAFLLVFIAVLSIIFRKPLLLLVILITSSVPSMPIKLKWKIKKMLLHIHKSFGVLESPLSLFTAIILTLIIWTCESTFFYAVFAAMGFTFTFSESVFAFLIVFFGVNLFPIAIVGIGIFEASILLFGKLIGFNKSLLAVSVQLHAAQIALYGILLIVLMVILKMDLIALIKLFKKASTKKSNPK